MDVFKFEVFNGERVVRTVSEPHPSLRHAGARALTLIGQSILEDEGSWDLQEWRVQVCAPDGLILVTIGGYAVKAAAAIDRATP